MSQLTDEYFKQSNYSSMDLESLLNFIVDHYFILMKKHRILEAQINETARKKEYAHEQLQRIRNLEVKIRKTGKVLTEQEKIELQECKYCWSSMREENDIVFYNGKEMELDQPAHVLLNHSILFSVIEKVDRKIRETLFNSFSFIHRKITGLFTDANDQILDSSKLKPIIETIIEENNKVSKQLEEKFLLECDIDLSDHRPLD